MNSIKACKHGTFLYPSNDQYVGKSLNQYGEYAEEEVQLFQEIIKPGDTVYDIGANIGTHSVVMSQIVGKNGLVFAFEPQRMAYYTLCANVAINHITNVICLQQAVGTAKGFIDVPELDYFQPNNFGALELQQDHESPGKCQVKVVAIDDMNRSVQFMKIDVEGMEIDVLTGSAKTIAKHRPVLYVENDRPEKSARLLMLIRNMNYNCYFHTPYLYNRNNFFDNKSNYFNNELAINMLCYPLEVPCPIDMDKYKFHQCGENQVVIAIPEKERAAKYLADMHNEVVSTLLKMALSSSSTLYDPDKGLEYLNLAIKMSPDDCGLYNQAAVILMPHKRYEEALEYNDKAFAKGGNDKLEIIHNRAFILDSLDRPEEAIKYYELAIEKKSDHVPSHFCLGCNLLRLSDYERGWKEYEWRFKMPDTPLRNFIDSLPDLPMWDGKECIKDKRILIFNEQGFGDRVQLIRCIKPLKEQTGAHTVLACTDRLLKLLKNCEGIDEYTSYIDEHFQAADGEFDYKVSIFSLPYFLGMNKIEPIGQYVFPQKDADWFDLSPYQHKFKVGITWAGNEAHKNDHNRSCFRKIFASLQIPGVQLFSLQKGSQIRRWPDQGEINLLEGSEDLDIIDWTEKFTDFNRTANLILGLDLVICVDTGIAHLGGALNKPTWLMVGKFPDWRWGYKGDKSDWYPSMKIFRNNEWDGMFAEVSKELKKFVNRHNLDFWG